MMNLLQVTNLNVWFQCGGHKVHAVRGVDFSVSRGEVLGIVGESGCGKSATVKALLKLLQDSGSSYSGQILYRKQDLALYSENQMQQIRGKEISMIFQDPFSSFNPIKKIGPQIMEGYFRHASAPTQKEGRKLALRLLKEAGLPDAEEIMEAYPQALSGGMRQRVLIAMSLITSPSLLIADEPTTSLDWEVQKQIFSLLKQHQLVHHMAMIVVTHDMRLAEEYCDRIIVMYAGKIVEIGSAREIFENSQHPYTQKLLASLPSFDQPKDQPLQSIPGIPPHLSLSLSHCGFCGRCQEAMNVCAEKVPPLYQISDTHFSACFKHHRRICE